MQCHLAWDDLRFGVSFLCGRSVATMIVGVTDDVVVGGRLSDWI
jgi:hypothetical protein